jgi:hypothetical protein
MMRPPTRRRCRLAAAVAVACLAFGLSIGAQAPVYFPDDPLAVDPETQDASGVKSWDVSDPYDFFENTFPSPATGRRAARSTSTPPTKYPTRAGSRIAPPSVCCHRTRSAGAPT